MTWEELVQSGAVGQAILGTMLGIGILWQVIHQTSIDPILAGFFGTVVGYFFRTTVTMSTNNIEP